MNFYIVMQGKSYHISKEQNKVWCAILDSAGNTPHSWERMTEVQKGDVLFHLVKGDIVAISQAQEDCRQGTFVLQASDEIGNMFDAKYEELPIALNVKEHFEAIRPILPLKYAAFQQNGDGNQGFLYPCNEMLAIKLLELISEANIFPETEQQLEFAIGPIAKQERNILAPVLYETEAEAKVKVRKGEQKFKAALAPIWDHKCALCGIELPELLRASYAKPWKDATAEERLDPYNGVLLCSNHATLYERGFIAFDGTGRIHISPSIPSSDYGKYGIHAKMRINREEQHKVYIKWHKRNVFK